MDNWTISCICKDKIVETEKAWKTMSYINIKKVPSELCHISQVLENNKHGNRLVGGAVRDLLIGKTPKDFDIATSATPEVVKSVLNNAGIQTVDTGIEHGTITAVINSQGFEITTLRKDVSTDGRRATVAWTTSYLEDSERRDFTFNAMYADLKTGVVTDFHGGKKDLQNQVVRFVGKPDERIQEDYLRILRAFRFLGRFENGVLDSDVVGACSRNAHGLEQLSGERIWSEMSKIFSSSVDLAKVVSYMERSGVFKQLGFSNLNLNKMNSVRQHSTNPVTLFVALAGERAVTLGNKWKWSAKERDLAVFLSRLSTQEKYHVKTAVLDLVDGVEKDHALEGLKLFSNKDYFLLESNKIPVFPVTGKDLLGLGMSPGSEMGKTLKELKTLWKNSEFSMSKKDLLESCGIAHENKPQ